jgi:NAD(P)-dependent dehydrogenase (short-subunit alcohol dehydrogenase family)
MSAVTLHKLLDGRAAIVTGAGGDIGRAIVVRHAQERPHVR